MALRHMSSSPSLPQSAGLAAPRTPSQSEAERPAPGLGLVPPAPAARADEVPTLCAPVARLPVLLNVAVPIREFRVRNLLALGTGRVIESQWRDGEDVPLSCGDVQLAWSEFEVLDQQLAVRVTRLA